MATFEAPKWFNYEFYMGAKLVQVQKADPEGKWDMTKLVDTFAANNFLGEEGAYNHFTAFGAGEDVAPNAMFNANEYYAAKAAQFYGVEPKAVTELQIANVKVLIEKAGYNAWTHYDAFGSDEGVNPSNAFDADAYMAAKAAAMGGDWTKEKVAEAFKTNGFTALEHFLQFGGTGENEITAEQVKAGFPVDDTHKVPTASGETFTLTVNPDTITGTAGDDIINAPFMGGIGSGPTLTVGDNIDGGAGTDTLNVWGGDFSGVTMKNVEIVNHAVAGNLNVSAYADVKEVWQNAAVDTNVVTANIATKVGFGGTSTDGQTVTFMGTDGTADAATVALKDAKMTSVTVDSSATGAVKVEAQTLELAGKNVLSTGFTNNAMTSLIITGEGSLAGAASAATVATTAGLKSVDASAAKGDLNLNITGASTTEFKYDGSQGVDKVAFNQVGTQKATVALGTGEDTLTITAVGKAGSTYDGGEGTDTLVLSNVTTAFGKTDSAMFTNFEALTLQAHASATAAATTKYDVATGISGIASYKVDMANTTSGKDATVEVTNIANDTTFTVKGLEDAGTNALTLNLSTKAAAVKDADINLTFDNGATAAAAGSQIDSFTTNAKVLNLVSDGAVTSADGTHNALTLKTVATGVNDALTTIKISGDQAFDLTTGTATALTKIDGSEATGKLNIDASGIVDNTSNAGAVTILGGTADDTITAAVGGSGKVVATSITGGAGADKIVLGAVANNVGDTIVITAQGDSTAAAYDKVTNFSAVKATADNIDLKTFDFKDAAANIDTTTAATIKGAGENATFSIAANDTATFFKGSDNTTTGVVLATNNTDTFVFIDADKDGAWNADTDSVILLVGVDAANLTAADNFVFTAA